MRANDAFARTIAALTCKRIAAAAIGAAIAYAFVVDAGWRAARRVADLACAASRRASRDAFACFAGLSRWAHHARARRDARKRRVIAARVALLIRRAAIRFARIVEARAEMTGLVAAKAGHIVAIVDDALALVGAEVRANLATRAGHAITRILAARLTLADAYRRLVAIRVRGCIRGGAENDVVPVLHGLARAITAIIGYAIRAERRAVFALRHVIAFLSWRAGEFAAFARLGASAAIAALDAFLAGAANRRLAGVLLVCREIAVVIEAIALLVGRVSAADTNNVAIHAGDCALRADALRDAASLADIAERRHRRRRIDRSINAVRRGTRFIDLAVAIVIDTVANLRRGADRADACRIARAIALHSAWLARREAPIAGIKHRVVGRQAGITGDDAVVDGAFAIVVLAVANLWRGTDVVQAIERSSRTSDRARDAFADIAAAG